MGYAEDQVQKVMKALNTPGTVISCQTYEEAQSLFQILAIKNVRWNGGLHVSEDKIIGWEAYKADTIYTLRDGMLLYGNLKHAISRGDRIVYFQDMSSSVSLWDMLSV